MNLYLTESAYRAFQSLIRSLGYSVSEFVDQVITSSVANSSQLQPRPQINLNVAIAKAEAKPVVNLGDFVARKDLDELIERARKLRERAERERQQSDVPMPFTVEQAKKLEESIKKTLRGVRHLEPEKLQEVEAALAVLKGIRGHRP